MESTLRRRNGRTASAISVGSAIQPSPALGLDAELGLPFSLDGPADASLASWSHPGSSSSATLATSQAPTVASTSTSRASRLPRIDGQLALGRVTANSRDRFASLHASSSSSTSASSSSIPRPLASIPVPRRRVQTTPSRSSVTTSISTPSRERTASQPVVGQAVPRLELSPQSLASFKRSFRETGEQGNDSSAPHASSSTLRLSTSPSDSASSSDSRLDFAFLDASASPDMSASSSGTSPEVDSPAISSLQMLPFLTSQPSIMPFRESLYGSSSSLPRHSPPTPSAHTRVKRRRSGSRGLNSPTRPTSSLPRLIGRSRRGNITSAPEILESNAQADMSQQSGEDARFLDTPAPESQHHAATSTRNVTTHPSTSDRAHTIQPPLLTEVRPAGRQSSGAATSSTDTSRPSQIGLVHRRPRRLAQSRHADELRLQLYSLPLPELERGSPLPALPPLGASSRDDATLALTSPISLRRRRGNAEPPLELGELPSFDIDWDQIRFGEGARFDSQTTSRRTNTQPQRPNLHRNATAVSPPEESPLSTPDGDLSVTRPAESYRTFFRTDRDGDIIMEGQDESEDIVLPDAQSDISREDTASPDEGEVPEDNDYDGLSDNESVASSSSWLRTIVGEGEGASSAGDWASAPPTLTVHEEQAQLPGLNNANGSSNTIRDTAANTASQQLGTQSNESAPWNLASEFQRAERLSQLIERRRSIATEVESYQTRNVTATQEALERIERYSDDTRARLRSLRAQINRDRDAFLEPFEWQLTSDDEEVTSATSRQANVSAGARSRARLWGEIQTDQPLSRNLLTSPVGLPRPSLSVSTATSSGLRSSGPASLRRRPGSLGTGSMRGPTRSSNEAWLRNQGIDLHESLSLPSLLEGSASQQSSTEELDDEAASFESLPGIEGASSNWSRGSSSAARALRRIAARLPADSAVNEQRQGGNVTAADLLRQFGGANGEEDHLSLPALRYPRTLASYRSGSSGSVAQEETGPHLNVNLPSISPLSNLLPLPPLDAASTHSVGIARSADLDTTLGFRARAQDHVLDDAVSSWPHVAAPNAELPGVPGRFRWRVPADLASAQTVPRPASPPSFQAPVSHFARSRLLDRLRDQSSRANMQSGLSEDLPALHQIDNMSTDEASPQDNLVQARQSLERIRHILDDLETRPPRASRNGSSDPSSSNTSTLLSPPDRTATSTSALHPLRDVEARPSRLPALAQAGSGWQPGTRSHLVPRSPDLPPLPPIDSLAPNEARASRPRRQMLQPFDEIYAEVEAEFAGRDRVRERLPRRRSAFMQDILAELEQRRSASSAQVESRASRNLNSSGSSTTTHGNQASTSEDHLRSVRTSRDRLLERLSNFSRNQPSLPSRPSETGPRWTERSMESSFARRWDSLLSEDEEDRVPLPPFMWRSLRTSTTLGGIAAESANYVSDSELDTSYEGLLALSDRIGSARPRGATESALREGLERSSFKMEAIISVSSNSSEAVAVDREVRCGICLEDYSEGDVLAKSKKCGHALHTICFETWLKRVDTCPICRQSAV